MYTRRSEWEYDKEFTAEPMRAVYLKKYNNLLSLGRWSNKDTKDTQILALVGLDQKLADDSKKSSENPTHLTGIKLRKSKPTSGTSQPRFWKSHKVE